jgi:hypothetical protein
MKVTSRINANVLLFIASAICDCRVIDAGTSLPKLLAVCPCHSTAHTTLLSRCGEEVAAEARRCVDPCNGDTWCGEKEQVYKTVDKHQRKHAT